MTTFSQLVYDGIGDFQVKMKVRNKWRTFTFPTLANNTGSPIKETWVPFRKIERVAVSGKKEIDVAGYHVVFEISIPCFERDYLVELKSIADYATDNNEPIYVIPHSDFLTRNFRCKVVDEYSFGWIQGYAVGHSTTMRLYGIDLFKHNPTVGNELISHYSENGEAYEATDLGIHQYIARGCPWNFDEFIDGDKPGCFIYSGVPVIGHITIDSVKEGAMLHGVSTGYLLYMTDIDDGYAQTSFAFASGATTGAMRLLFRSTNFNNYYFVEADLAANTVVIGKRVASAETVLATYTLPDHAYTLVAAKWYQLKVTFVDAVLRVYIRERNYNKSIAAIGTVDVMGGLAQTKWVFLGSITNSVFTTGQIGAYHGTGDNVYTKELDGADTAGDIPDYDAADLVYAAHYTDNNVEGFEHFEP